LNLIFGMMTAGITVHIVTALQQWVSNRFLGRTMTTYTALQAFAQVGGMAVVSATVAQVGVRDLLAFNGLLALFSSGLTWILLAEKSASCFGGKTQGQQE